MKYFRFRTFTTSYYFPRKIIDYQYMFGLYSAYGGIFSKIYWWLFRSFAIIRWLSVIDETAMPTSCEKIKQIEGEENLMAFNMGSPGMEQKISILGYDYLLNRPFFAKFSEKECARELTKNEIEIYELLAKSNLTPQLLSCKIDEDFVYMKTEYVNGTRLKHIGLTDDIVNLALSLTRFHLSGVYENKDGLKMSLSHGDFCPWNILEKDGCLNLIDWELAKDRPLGFDIFTYICQVSALLCEGETMMDALRKYETLLRTYFSTFGIKDYIPYLRYFAEEKYIYEASKEGSFLFQKYKKLKNSLGKIKRLN